MVALHTSPSKKDKRTIVIKIRVCTSVRSKERKGNERENSENFVWGEQTWERAKEKVREVAGVTMLFDYEERA